MGTFSDAVRALSDDGLVALLRARPDLASPSPSTLRSLAARASSRSSLERALAHTDTPTLQVLEAVLALEELAPERADDVAVAVGASDAAEVAAVHGLVRRARGQALLWSDDDEDGVLRTVPGLAEVLGPFPAGLGPVTGADVTGIVPTAALPGVAPAAAPPDGPPVAAPPGGTPATALPDGTPVPAPPDGPPVAALPDVVAPEPHPALAVAGAREVLDALAWGPPVGTLPPARTAARTAVDALLATGLLAGGDGETVLLPREVGLALRGGRTHRSPRLAPPEPASAGAGRSVPSAVVEAEAASAGVEAVRLVDTLLRAWEDAPPPVLRAGGLGVRDLKRAAQVLGVAEPTAAAVVELATAAGLVDDDGEAPPSYVPTTRADAWDEAETADRWGMLALAWAGSRRTPWLAGTRDERGAVRAPLGSDLSRGWVPRLRAQVLTALATHAAPADDTPAAGPGTSAPEPLAGHAAPADDAAAGPAAAASVGSPATAAARALLAAAARPGGLPMTVDDVVADLAWRAPRAVPPVEAVEGLLREAALLGVTGAGVLAPTGRAVLALLDGAEQADGADAEALLAETLRAILPASVDEVLLQGDLTGIVPGRPSRELAVLIDRAAEVESRGAATTVRFTPASVTRALDAGMTGEELLDALTSRSRTPVPQPLEYLVHDTARRHAALRVGSVGSYVRAADPAVLTGLVGDERLAELGLVQLAPTVVAASAPAATLQAALRRRGLLAALEGPDGRPLGRLRRPPRVERGGARGLRSPYATAGAPTSDDGRRALVERLRIADGAGRRSPFASTAGGAGGVSIAALRAAGRSGDEVGREPRGDGGRGNRDDGGRNPRGDAWRDPRGDTMRDPRGDGTARRSPASGGGTAPRPPHTPGVPPPGTLLPVDALALLREAVRDGGHVWLELVDGHGRPVRRRVRPLKVEAGRLRAVDTDRGAELSVAVHRIAQVEPDLT